MIDLLTSEDVVFQEEPRAYIYRGKEYRSVTDRLKEQGMQPDFSAVSPALMEWYLNRGTMVHLACEYADQGRLDMQTVDPRIQGFVEGHLRMMRELKPKVIAIERPLVVPKIIIGGVELIGVGGRPDVVYWISGRRALVDRKSGNNGVKKNGWVQTGGYKFLWDRKYPKAQIQDRYIEHLYQDGSYWLEPCNDPMDIQAFLDVLRTSELTQRMNYWRQRYGHATNVGDTSRIASA